jgi:hypothetical protein
MKNPRPSRVNNGVTDHSISQAPERAETSKSGKPILDGGNSSDSKEAGS